MILDRMHAPAAVFFAYLPPYMNSRLGSKRPHLAWTRGKEGCSRSRLVWKMEAFGLVGAGGGL